MSKPKVRRGWQGSTYDAEAILRFSGRAADIAAAIWLVNGRCEWVAYHSEDADELQGNIDQGACDTGEQAQAAAIAALRAAGYEVEGEGEGKR